MNKLIFGIAFIFTLVLVTSTSVSAVETTFCQISDSLSISNSIDTNNNETCNLRLTDSYDASGSHFKVFGDGRPYEGVSTVNGSVIDSVSDLDAATLTTCTYHTHARGDFDSYANLLTDADNGNIFLVKNCNGYEFGGGHYTELYRIVSSTDPSYTGDSWGYTGGWEFQVWTQSHKGNIIARNLPPTN